MRSLYIDMFNFPTLHTRKYRSILGRDIQFSLCLSVIFTIILSNLHFFFKETVQINKENENVCSAPLRFLG